MVHGGGDLLFQQATEFLGLVQVDLVTDDLHVAQGGAQRGGLGGGAQQNENRGFHPFPDGSKQSGEVKHAYYVIGRTGQ